MPSVRSTPHANLADMLRVVRGGETCTSGHLDALDGSSLECVAISTLQIQSKFLAVGATPETARRRRCSAFVRKNPELGQTVGRLLR
jgi:hypothetical protein